MLFESLTIFVGHLKCLPFKSQAFNQLLYYVSNNLFIFVAKTSFITTTTTRLKQTFELLLFHCLTFSISFARPLTSSFEQIIEHKIDLKVESKIGSLANIKHKPGGGDKKVFNDVEYLRQTSSTLHSNNISRTGSRRESATQVTFKLIEKLCSKNCLTLHFFSSNYCNPIRVRKHS